METATFSHVPGALQVAQGDIQASPGNSPDSAAAAGVFSAGAAIAVIYLAFFGM